LTEVSSAAGLPPESKLVAGGPRGAPGAPPRNLDNDVWAADLHLTPDEKLLYISERTTSSLSAFRADAASGKLAYAGNTPTEKQPRGFAIDPKGKFLIASGEKSLTISVYAIDGATGGLRMLKQYPVGKGANWVEIVSFD
jgi:6-phosphogluconolactonase